MRQAQHRLRTPQRAAGNYARAIGENWENALEELHGYLANQGRAVMHKTGPQVTMRKGRTGLVEPMITGPGPADYVGCLADGRFVGFEAKTTGDAQGFTLIGADPRLPALASGGRPTDHAHAQLAGQVGDHAYVFVIGMGAQVQNRAAHR